jgi:hypothetical protein
MEYSRLDLSELAVPELGGEWKAVIQSSGRLYESQQGLTVLETAPQTSPQLSPQLLRYDLDNWLYRACACVIGDCWLASAVFGTIMLWYPDSCSVALVI